MIDGKMANQRPYEAVAAMKRLLAETTRERELLREALGNFVKPLGPEEKILWGDARDDELMTISIRMDVYRRCQALFTNGEQR